MDWLRIIAFCVLIFYHIGLLYVTWDWHVKSAYAASTIEPLMILINPWRLPLLFFISGVALRFAFEKSLSQEQFFSNLFKRLGAPILFGVVFVVTPQTYFELRQSASIEAGYFSFFASYLAPERLILNPTWHHLWYIVYLLLYSLILTSCFPVLRQKTSRLSINIPRNSVYDRAWILFLIPVLFAGYAVYLDPIFPLTNDFWSDWAHHAHRFTIFLIGFLFARSDRFWRGIFEAAPLAVVLATGIVAVRIGLYFTFPLFYQSDFSVSVVVPVLTQFYAWAVIVALLGGARRWLNKPSPVLSYLTGAVFFYYILHQLVIIASGYYLTQIKLGPALEAFFVVMLTIGICGAGYEAARRIPKIGRWVGINH